MNALRLILLCCLIGSGCDSPAPDANKPLPGETDGNTDDSDVDLCDFSSFAHPLGYPCNAHRDCESGECYPVGNESFCTQACDPAMMGSCPSGMACEYLGSNNTLARCMLSSSGTTLPQDGSLRPGSPCNSTRDCASDSVCGSVRDSSSSYYTFCAPRCESDADCNGCGTCDQLGSSGMFCVPQGVKPVGESCETRHECESFLCREFCTQVCGGSVNAPCPGDSTCELTNNGSRLCVPAHRKAAVAEGEACRDTFQCAPGSKCILDDSRIRNVCTAPRTAGVECQVNEQCAPGLSCRYEADARVFVCTPPGPTGAACITDADCRGALQCRAFSPDYRLCSEPCREDAECGDGNSCVATDINTTLSLFTGVGDTTARAFNDDIDQASGNTWSRIRFTAQPGTYWVRVSAPHATRGRYTLELLDGVNTPTAFTETGGELNAFPNGTLAEAQQLNAFPATVSGIIFNGADVDHYAFTIPGTEPVELVVQTGPGAPSACLPDGDVGTVAMGDPCRFNQACESGVCERRLGVCGGDCDVDSGCADGFACVALTNPDASHLTCVTERHVGIRPTGSTCTFHHQCADAYCASFRGELRCLPRCDDDADACREELECAGLDVVEAQESHRHQVCVPRGAGDVAFNAPCLLQSDCASDLVCDEGVCRQACRTTDDCPPGAPLPPNDEITCKPCDAFTYCGADFKGECWNDSFCVRPCIDGACTTGFSCLTNDEGNFCVPSEGACHAASCRVEPDAEAGLCVVPFAGLASRCRSSFDCVSGTCADGLCSTACGADAECGCATDDFVCADAQCARAPGIKEIDSNDDESSAQELTGDLPLRVYASIRTPGEADYFKLTLPEDAVINVATRTLCKLNPKALDTRLFILKDGRVVASDSPYARLGSIDTFVASEGGEYFIKVEDEPKQSKSDSEYVLTVEPFETP